MTTLEMKEKISELVDILPEAKIGVLLDFLEFLYDREKASDLLSMQMQSDAYQEWVNDENDIYDQVFANV